MRNIPLYVNELYDVDPPKPHGKGLQNVQKQPTSAVSKSTRMLIGASLLLNLLTAVCLVVMLVFYFQKETCLKEKDKEAMISALKTESTPIIAKLCDGKCTSGWKKNGAYCYYISTARTNWDNAEKFCKSHNSRLASIGTKEEMIYLSSMMKENQGLWVGSTDLAGTCSFVERSAYCTRRFVDVFPPWMVYLPGERKECAQLKVGRLWNDTICSKKLQWICKKSVCTK